MELLLKLGVFVLLAVIGYWRGRRNERAHLRWLADEEKRLAHVLVFATRYPPAMEGDQRALDPVMLSGSVVVASDFFRLLVASLRKVVGGNYVAHERLLERARRHALIKLKQQASEQGVRMVFNLRYGTARISDPRRGEATQVEVLAWGTGFVKARGSVAQSRVHHQPNPHIHAGSEGEDLMKNPASRWWVLGWFAGVLYVFGEAMTDTLWTHAWRYLHGAPWLAFALAGVLLAALLAHNGRRHRLSWSASIILAVLTAPLLALVFYFAGLRINGALAMLQAPEPTVYQVQANRQMLPLASDMPAWTLDADLSYWDTIIRPGTEERILVVRGPLGFYQYDIQPLRARYRVYWQQRREK